MHDGSSRTSAKGHKSAPQCSIRDQTEIQNSASKSSTYEVLARESWVTTENIYKIKETKKC